MEPEVPLRETGADTLNVLLKEESRCLVNAGLTALALGVLKRLLADTELGFHPASSPEQSLFEIQQSIETADKEHDEAEDKLRKTRERITRVSGWRVVAACGSRVPVELGARYRFFLTNSKGRYYCLEGELVECDGYWIRIRNVFIDEASLGCSDTRLKPFGEPRPTEDCRFRESIIGTMFERI